MEARAYGGGHVVAWHLEGGEVRGKLADYLTQMAPLALAGLSLEDSGRLQSIVVGPATLMRAKALGVLAELDPMVEGLDRVMEAVGYERGIGAADYDRVKFFAGPGDGTGTPTEMPMPGGDVTLLFHEGNTEVYAMLVACDVEQVVEFFYEKSPLLQVTSLPPGERPPASFKVKLEPGVSALVMNSVGNGLTVDNNTGGYRLCHRLAARGEGCAFLLKYIARDGGAHPSIAQDIIRVVPLRAAAAGAGASTAGPSAATAQAPAGAKSTSKKKTKERQAAEDAVAAAVADSERAFGELAALLREQAALPRMNALMEQTRAQVGALIRARGISAVLDLYRGNVGAW